MKLRPFRVQVYDLETDDDIVLNVTVEVPAEQFTSVKLTPGEEPAAPPLRPIHEMVRDALERARPTVS